MGFADLPEFPQGGAARAESGNMGIPPESFMKAQDDAGLGVLTAPSRPEDAPAVQAALGREVDTTLAAMGQTQPQPVPQAPVQPQAPAAAPPDTQQPQPAPQYQPAPAAQPADPATGATVPLSDNRPFEDRIRGIQSKYGGDFDNLAKAHVHSEAARTRISQERSGEIAALDGRMERIEQVLTDLSRRPAGNPTPPRVDQGNPEDLSHTGGQGQTDEFYRDPRGEIRSIVNDALSTHLTAYKQAQNESEEEQQFDRMMRDNRDEIERLKPVMDQVFEEEQHIFTRLPKPQALGLLMKRARERHLYGQALQYHREVTAAFGNGSGQPNQPAPNPAASLPGASAATGQRGGESQPVRDWSRTPNFERLWKSRSDSRDEMGSLTDILKERNFWNEI